MYLCLHTHIYIYKPIYIYILYIYVSLCICIYIYTYLYIYIYLSLSKQIIYIDCPFTDVGTYYISRSHSEHHGSVRTCCANLQEAEYGDLVFYPAGTSVNSAQSPTADTRHFV